MIMSKLDQFKYDGAAAIAEVMLVSSFLLLLILNGLQRLGLARQGVKG
jgi:sulfate transport system permease protein